MNRNIGGITRRRINAVYEKLVVLRNELGIPYFYHARILTQSNFKNSKLKVNVLPAFFNDDRKNQPPTDVNLYVDLKYIHHTDNSLSSGVILPIISHKGTTFCSTSKASVTLLKLLSTFAVGAGVNKREVFSAAVNADVNYNIPSKKLTVKHKPTQQDLFYSNLVPYTFVDSYANKIQLNKEKEFKPIYNEDDLRPVRNFYI